MLDNYYAFKFVRLLTKPYTETEAFRFGIIDASGNFLRKPETSDEKQAYNKFHKLVWNLRQLLERLPFGKTMFARYATALALLREEVENNGGDGQLIQQAFNNYLVENFAGGIDIVDKPLNSSDNGKKLNNTSKDEDSNGDER